MAELYWNFGVAFKAAFSLTIHNEHNVALEEALVAECCNSGKDVLVSVRAKFDVTSLCQAAEWALVTSPSSLRVELGGDAQVNLACTNAMRSNAALSMAMFDTGIVRPTRRATGVLRSRASGQ